MAILRWLTILVSIGAAVAQTPKLGGDYSGVLGPLHLKLHLKVGSGAVEGTLDSVDQGANGLVVALPVEKPCDFAWVLKFTGADLKPVSDK